MGDQPPAVNDTKALKAFSEPKFNDIQSSIGKASGILDVDATSVISAQLKALTMKVDSLANLGIQQLPTICELCAGTHATDQCAISSESAQFVSNFQKSQQLAPATYYPNNRNHPNFSWSNNQKFMQQPQQQFQQHGAGPFNPSGFQQQFAPKQQFQAPGIQQQNHGMVGQTSNESSELEELSDTEANPGKKEVKEQVQAITLRFGKVTKEQVSTAERNKEESKQQDETPVLSSESESGKTDVGADLNKSNVEASRDSTEKSAPKHNEGVKQVYPPPPYPRILQKHKLDKQFAKFLDVFKKLQINIPFAEALKQMPSNAKFMKDILSRKLNIEELEIVVLTEECSAVLQQKLPPKLKDLGSFTIPCTIGMLSFDKCSCDLGATINLMPLSVFTKLGLSEPKPTNMSLQLADRSITYPRVFMEIRKNSACGPIDRSLMFMQEDHISTTILVGGDRRRFDVRQYTTCMDEWVLDDQQRHLLHSWGFGGAGVLAYPYKELGKAAKKINTSIYGSFLRVERNSASQWDDHIARLSAYRYEWDRFVFTDSTANLRIVPCVAPPPDIIEPHDCFLQQSMVDVVDTICPQTFIHVSQKRPHVDYNIQVKTHPPKET
ncbi:hypothetical protein DCAR_0933675 [Daucus carota subsp. sativus]|uniref:Uncharacterized protein n=1 Tax=Daucus carota subsp. sativus TaxID=79200 RepID=A0AAF0XW07_DAUCS|nr:PREDICTED: uncharacterized protein LOC108201067 [Daucus carota subsp. sativus]WOH14159.1 hypothetical protein DCAR_0933675 [Daucus carota subsp. sativus]